MAVDIFLSAPKAWLSVQKHITAIGLTWLQNVMLPATQDSNVQKTRKLKVQDSANIDSIRNLEIVNVTFCASTAAQDSTTVAKETTLIAHSKHAQTKRRLALNSLSRFKLCVHLLVIFVPSMINFCTYSLSGKQ